MKAREDERRRATLASYRNRRNPILHLADRKYAGTQSTPRTSTPVPNSTVSSSSLHDPLLPGDSLWVAHTAFRLGRTQWRGPMCSLPDKPGRGPLPLRLPASLLLLAVCLPPSQARALREGGGLTLSTRHPHRQGQCLAQTEGCRIRHKILLMNLNVNFRSTTRPFMWMCVGYCKWHTNTNKMVCCCSEIQV